MSSQKPDPDRIFEDLIPLEFRGRALAPRRPFVLVVGSVGRAHYVLDGLSACGWRVERSRLRASKNGGEIHVLLSSRRDMGRGCAHRGWLLDDDIELRPQQHDALRIGCMGVPGAPRGRRELKGAAEA